MALVQELLKWEAIAFLHTIKACLYNNNSSVITDNDQS